MKRLLTLLLISGAAHAAPSPRAPSRDDAAVASIQKQLAPFATLHGRFTQTKRIRVLSRPLVSSGDFVLVKERGLLWRTTEPIAAAVRITPGGIAQLKDGKTTVLVSAKDQPGVSAVGKVLFAIFSLDLGRFREHFAFRSAAAPAGKPWTAVLAPTDAGLATFVRSIELTGERTLEGLTLVEANGDVTSIRFADTRATPLTPQEEALFE